MIGDTATEPEEHKAGADVNTLLAMERTYLAYEGTLMGWIRTALSMISFGFTLGKLGQVLKDVSVKGFLGHIRTLNLKELSYLLVVLGTLTLLWAAFQSWRRVRKLRTMGYESPEASISIWVALMLVVVGGLALFSLVLQD